ncbi:methyltransferase domain-containing protein [Dehalococcoidia bacterium]|nr:methyltransferase domain-containing protein [Dehalococcoidia bacterium]
MPKSPRLSWDSELYENKHSFVWEAASDLVKLLDPKPGQKILDLGCGPGHLTAKIADSGAQVTGIDSSGPMIAQARMNFPSLPFSVADARDMRFDEPFDAVFSNAVLHWIPEAKEVVSNVWHALKPSGKFVAEFGGKGNVKNIVDAMHVALGEQGINGREQSSPWYFPDVDEYKSLLGGLGFVVQGAWLFPRPTPLAGSDGLCNWMTMFAGSFLHNLSARQREAVIQSVERQLRSTVYREGCWVADYMRLRMVAVKISQA